MEFDYEAAKLRVQRELAEIVEPLFERLPLKERKKREGKFTLEEKTRRVHERGFLYAPQRFGFSDHITEVKGWRFSLLFELNFGTFWHALDHIREMRENLSAQDLEFYVRLVIEQGKHSKEENKNYSFPGHRHGCFVLVELYDEGKLDPYVDNDLLRELVNRGFWELANQYFDGDISHIGLGRAPEILKKYMRFLDLTRVDEFWEKPLFGSYWVTEEYIAAVEMARGKLRPESASKIVAPIVQNIFRVAFWEVAETEQYLKGRLAPYLDYLQLPLVQEAVKYELREVIRRSSSDGDSPFTAKSLSVGLKYLNLDGQKAAEFVSAEFTREKLLSIGAAAFVKMRIPPELLTREKREEVRKLIFEELERRFKGCSAPFFEISWDLKGMIIEGVNPVINLAQLAIDAGLLDRETGGGIIVSEASNFLYRKHVPAKAVTIAMQRTLRPGYINDELFRAIQSRVKGLLGVNSLSLLRDHGISPITEPVNLKGHEAAAAPKREKSTIQKTLSF